MLCFLWSSVILVQFCSNYILSTTYPRFILTYYYSLFLSDNFIHLSTLEIISCWCWSFVGWFGLPCFAGFIVGFVTFNHDLLHIVTTYVEFNAKKVRNFYLTLCDFDKSFDFLNFEGCPYCPWVFFSSSQVMTICPLSGNWYNLNLKHKVATFLLHFLRIF